MSSKRQGEAARVAVVVLAWVAAVVIAIGCDTEVCTEGSGGEGGEACGATCPVVVAQAACPAFTDADLVGRCSDLLAGTTPLLLERGACAPSECYPPPRGLFVDRYSCGGADLLTLEMWCVP